ncbi:CRISPR-associated RAMP protein, Csx10 family [Thalassoporum mexicanum PCC 7367]|uniref:type III-D CRISPR-associated RAMP protein Csx10 n=1 Tax=Thalassoporum mexicanum TaxID=3457544 RepID=UPI00029F9948|nr:CRISPR-associated RAMP protein Csx10 [Pseudanabaena sp. PCC 7367]AFY68747.1 CRISPR-associated RAMP protein, Csx10 family [Pseudanabaena sp. PCC 7367]
MQQVDLTITALSPLAIGKKKPGGSVSEACDYIPGTVIRGAIAAKILEQAQPNLEHLRTSENDFKSLFLDDGAAIFQNAYPAIYKHELEEEIKFARIASSKISILPATALSAKTHSGFRNNNKTKKKGVFDTLIDRFCAQCLNQIYAPVCPNLEGKESDRTDTYSGFYCTEETDSEVKNYHSISIDKRLLTRVGINRKLNTAEESILYSIEVLNEMQGKNNQQVIYKSSILLENKELANALIDYIQANQQSFRFGGSISRGLGRVELKAESNDTNSNQQALGNRVKAFNAKLEEQYKDWQKLFGGRDFNPKKLYFTIDLQSDAILSENWLRTTIISPEMLQQFVNKNSDNQDLQLEIAYSSYDYLSGWNAAWGLKKDVELVTKMGAVYLFSISQENEEDWLERLAKLEITGVGDRTCEGFGQVRVCDRFHLNLWEESK